MIPYKLKKIFFFSLNKIFIKMNYEQNKHHIVKVLQKNKLNNIILNMQNNI